MFSKSITLFSVLVFSFSALAVKPGQVDFAKINLVGIKILEAASREDSFQRSIKLLKNPSSKLVQTLQSESLSQIVSPLYELNEQSSFKNIYVYIGKTQDGQFEFVQAMLSRSGSIFVVDMDITDVTKKEMKAVHGPTGEKVTYIITKPNGSLFP